MNEPTKKLAVTNLAWPLGLENLYLEEMASQGFMGLEIAPSKFIGVEPYTSGNIERAKKKSERIKNIFGISIISMQSIWFSRTEQIFSSDKDRHDLLDYTKRAFDFAQALGCPHVVFGNPKNRNGNLDLRNEIAMDFFGKISTIAEEFQIFLGIEPIPTSYKNTFLTTFEETRAFLSLLNSNRIGLNFDFGSILINSEFEAISKNYIEMATHFHISEPNLQPIAEHMEHKLFFKLLDDLKPNKWISIEAMDIEFGKFKQSLSYVKSLSSQQDN